MKNIRLLVSSYAGPPRNPKTWSGTTLNLISALENDGKVICHAHNAQIENRFGQMAKRIDSRIGFGLDHVPGSITRPILATRTAIAAQIAHCAATLHMGTYDIRASSKPSFIFVDNSFDLWETYSSAARAISQRRLDGLRNLEHRALRSASHIFTIGEHVAENIKERCGITDTNITAVGSGMGSITPWHGEKNYSNGELLIVAKLRPWDKGLKSLIEAFSIARRARPDLHLTVIGGQSLKELDGINGIRATGWLEQRELQEIFQQASLFVMPARYEPWGLAYLEALACRTPIMGLPRLSFPELSGHGQHGFLLKSDSPDELSHSILQALADPDHLQEMGNKGQKACLERYQWSNVANNMTNIMKRYL